MVFPSQEKYRKRLAADLVGGAPADVVLVNYRGFTALAFKNAFEPLGSYLEKSSVVSLRFLRSAHAGFLTWRSGSMYSTKHIKPGIVLRQRNLFDAAGLSYPDENWTWDDFIRLEKR